MAFERSVMLPDAIKNTMIYLNFAAYCFQMDKFEPAELYVENFIKMSEHMRIRNEVYFEYGDAEKIIFFKKISVY